MCDSWLLSNNNTGCSVEELLCFPKCCRNIRKFSFVVQPDLWLVYVHGTCDEAGYDERQDDHLEHAHEDVAGERQQHDGFFAEVVRAQDEADGGADEHAADRQHEQQVVDDPSQHAHHHAPHLQQVATAGLKKPRFLNQDF